MSAERQTFLNGNELPSAALVPQVLSDALDNVKYEMGIAKKPVTKEEAGAMGAGAFNMR